MKELRDRIEQLPDVTTRPMFGYQCYSVGGKFFTGFGKKNNLIIRLSKEHQLEALKDKSLNLKPFSHGAKMGWVVMNGSRLSNVDEVFELIRKGYEHARKLSDKL